MFTLHTTSPTTNIDHPHSEKFRPASKPGLFGWISDFRSVDDEFILNHQSLDGYLYVRFFKILVFMSFVGCLITWPVLFPVNATGGAGQQGFDILSFSNVAHPASFFAHALIAWVFFGKCTSLEVRDHPLMPQHRLRVVPDLARGVVSYQAAASIHAVGMELVPHLVANRALHQRSGRIPLPPASPSHVLRGRADLACI